MCMPGEGYGTCFSLSVNTQAATQFASAWKQWHLVQPLNLVDFKPFYSKSVSVIVTVTHILYIRMHIIAFVRAGRVHAGSTG